MDRNAVEAKAGAVAGSCPKGYGGQVLRVNLSTRDLRTEPLSPETARKYLGGRGLAASILFRELKPGTDPLSPDNKFMLATGPLAGTMVPGSTRHITACRSPLTGAWGEANAAGRFGPMLKAAGYDAVIVEGKAPTPVYIYIDEGSAEVRDASVLWGLPVADARDAILAATHPSAEAAVIGPAGENLSLYACVLTENDRAAGRAGTGAVMGSKNLKAVAVHGTRKIEFHDPEKLAELRQRPPGWTSRPPSSWKSGNGCSTSAACSTCGKGSVGKTTFSPVAFRRSSRAALSPSPALLRRTWAVS